MRLEGRARRVQELFREMVMTETTQTRCTACGSERLTWRIRRDRASLRDSRRTLLWTCGGCGHEWTEPLAITLEQLPESPAEA